MTTNLRRAAVLAAVLIALAGCATGTDSGWYEAYCADLGIEPGTAAFEECMRETRAWLEETHWRSEHEGRGP